MILITRNIVELLDLEQIKGSTFNEEDFGFNVLVQVTGAIITILLYFNIYRGSKIQLIFGALMTIFIFYCMVVSQYGSDWRDKGSMFSYFFQWLFLFFLFMILFAFQHSIIRGFLDEIIGKQK